MTAVIAHQQHYSADLLADLQLVTGELAGAFAGFPEREQLPIRHALAGSGKLLRPVVVLAASRCSGDPAPERIGVASAAELLHLASLLHDDVIDCAETRRGRPSLNASWGEGVAILTGDVYFSGALRRLATTGGGRFSAMFLECTADMSQSELRQTLARFDPRQTEQDYLAAISGKTASLFAACGRAGGLLAGLRAAEQDQLARYGWSAGMAFQLADDISDLTPGHGKKAAGHDIRVGVWTLPVLHCLKSPNGASLYHVIASERAADELPAIRAALTASGSLAYAIAQARAYCGQAREALAAVTATDADAALHGVIDRIEADLANAEAGAGA